MNTYCNPQLHEFLDLFLFLFLFLFFFFLFLSQKLKRKKNVACCEDEMSFFIQTARLFCGRVKESLASSGFLEKY